MSSGTRACAHSHTYAANIPLSRPRTNNRGGCHPQRARHKATPESKAPHRPHLKRRRSEPPTTLAGPTNSGARWPPLTRSQLPSAHTMPRPPAAPHRSHHTSSAQLPIATATHNLHARHSRPPLTNRGTRTAHRQPWGTQYKPATQTRPLALQTSRAHNTFGPTKPQNVRRSLEPPQQRTRANATQHASQGAIHQPRGHPTSAQHNHHLRDSNRGLRDIALRTLQHSAAQQTSTTK